MKLFVAFLALAATVAAQGTIVGSEHDFSTAPWNTGGDAKPNEVCGVCHIPHVEGRPASRTNRATLWARDLSTQTYTMYFGYGIQGTISAQPDGSTRMCLGCHDGSVALEQFHTFQGTGTSFIGTDARIPGKPNYDFGADHPISITYADDPAGAYDPGLRHRSTLFPGTVAGQTIADILEGGKVQCVSCHDPHNTDVPTGAAALLRIKNNDSANPSALCLACHIK